MKCRYCGEKLDDPELCPEGEQLWCNLCRTIIHRGQWLDTAWKEYHRHIAGCKECQRKLELTEGVLEYMKKEVIE